MNEQIGWGTALIEGIEIVAVLLGVLVQDIIVAS
jgi:hypothetical protein